MNHSDIPVTKSKLSDKQLSLLLALLVAIMPFSIDTYLPAMPMMAEALNSNVHTIEKSLSVYLVGAALGQLFGGSLSDLKGRKPICLVGLLIFVISTAWITQTSQADHLIALRLIQGAGAGMATVIVPAMVRDRYTGSQAAQMFATIGIIIMIAPAIAPMVGALIQGIWGWQAIFGFLLLYGVALLGCMYQYLPHNKPQREPNEAFWSGVFSRYQSVLKHKEAMGFLLLQGFCFSCMFVFLTESSWVYQHHYGLNQTQYAWAFMFNIIAMATFNRMTAWRLKKGSAPKNLLRAGLAVQVIAASVLLGWSLVALPPLPLMVLLLMLTIGAQGLIVPSNQAIYMSYFSREAGSANALLGACMQMIAALIGWSTAELHATTAGNVTVMPAMMFASTLCAIIAISVLSRSAFKVS
ncbi:MULTISPECIES: multidrug effflux MFS transporter [Vitreoscilla]|uniref:Bcr/CflA family efflux transporter n=1 Tax=Vitreoscilla stercoraria TaxID=61 RepID=A0ABY4E8N1_VITST|nr:MULTISPECIES: multidrug effflux MFS transporter [Vitreoscilla]UOO91817.1 multidrug effflux MFS transporter [Vitreoscilla stercoraria]